ncbi:MAG: CidA/LrgA family protein [Pseudomonadota bacterium]
MIRALALLLGLQLIGEAAAAALDLPLPGPVLGMLALFAILAATGGPGRELDGTAQGFLDNLGLLFVPAGVGVTLHLSLLAEAWLAFFLAIVVATLLSIVLTAWLFDGLSRLAGPQPQDQPSDHGGGRRDG